MPRKKRPAAKPAKRPYGSGSLSVAADGTVRARLPARIDPKRQARQFRTVAAAEAWLDAALTPAVVEDAAVTLGDWAGVFWETYVQPIRPPNTARWYLYAVRQLESLYATPVAEVRPSMLQAVVGALSTRVDGATIKGIVGVWRRCLEAAVDDDLLARNPAKRLTLPRAAPPSAKRFVTPAEARTLLAAIAGHRFEAAYALLLGCGLRIGEVLGLEWRHVDIAGRRAWIQRQWTNSHWREMPKGRVSRWVDLPPLVIAALIRHRDAQTAGSVLVMQSPHRANRGRGGKRHDEPRPWSRNQVAEDLEQLVKDAGLAHLTPHAARRGLLTAMLDGGVSPAVAAAAAGHSDPHTTLRFYVQASDDGRKQAADTVNEYLSGTDSGPETDD